MAEHRYGSYSAYNRCKGCGLMYWVMNAHWDKNSFKDPCPDCGRIDWKIGVIARWVSWSKWWNPRSWFRDRRLEIKGEIEQALGLEDQ